MNGILEKGLLARYRGDPPTLQVRQAHGTRIDMLQGTAILTITVSFVAMITVSFVTMITVSSFATTTMGISVWMERITMTVQSARVRSSGHQRNGSKFSIIDTVKGKIESSKRQNNMPKGVPTIDFLPLIEAATLHSPFLSMVGP